MDVEQTQAVEQTPTTDGTVSRDELIAAVREAGGTESVDVAAEEASAAATPPAEAAAAPAEEEPRIAAILRAREKATQEQETARNHAEEMLRKAREESDRILREAREQAAKEFQADLERQRAAFRSDPTGQIRAMGDPQEIIDRTLYANTPEGRKLLKLETELAETRKQAGAVDDVRKEFSDFKAEVERIAKERAMNEIRETFLGGHANKEKAPNLTALYEPEEIWLKGNELAARWQKSGLALGKDFDFDDVSQYLELDARKRADALRGTPAQQVSAGAPPKEPGNAPKVQANGPRTLSAAQGSERRTSPKPLSEMKPEEARQALIDEVAAARRANPDSVF
jgi:hypothetical protein